MKIYARQGDLVIEKLDNVNVGDLRVSKDIVFAGDSSGHRHRITGEIKARRDQLVTTILVEKEAQLVHEKADGHKTVVLKPGTYQVRPLRERGDGQDRAVED